MERRSGAAWTPSFDQTGDVEPRSSRVRRKAMVFGPLLGLVGVLVLALGVPWPVVAAALALFVLWLIVEG
jgi:hypothetical protein